MNTIYDWLKDGTTAVPNILFNRFSQLDLTAEEFLLLVYMMSKLNQSNEYDYIQVMEHQLGWDAEKIFDVMNALVTKDYLAIELRTNPEGKQADHYTLRPFFQKLDDFYFKDKQEGTYEVASRTQESHLVTDIEQEFGRVLTPLEIETINIWLKQDQYSEDLIRVALREAVIHRAINLKYIDRILLNWENNNIKTVHEAEAYIKDYQARKKSQTYLKNRTVEQQDTHIPYEIPIYDKYRKK